MDLKKKKNTNYEKRKNMKNNVHAKQYKAIIFPRLEKETSKKFSKRGKRGEKLKCC